uniref:Uncharacterized protein n=1 Tax=Micrurus spixii TaxID=129469 RepID=A0A2D4N927_9SAUR
MSIVHYTFLAFTDYLIQVVVKHGCTSKILENTIDFDLSKSFPALSSPDIQFCKQIAYLLFLPHGGRTGIRTGVIASAIYNIKQCAQILSYIAILLFTFQWWLLVI